jgi:hypothetical protein
MGDAADDLTDVGIDATISHCNGTCEQGGENGSCEHCDKEDTKDKLGGHTPSKCSPQKDGKPAHYDSGRHCPFCEEEIMACSVCEGLEGSLATECPKMVVSKDDQQLIYTGLLDFRDGRWGVRSYNRWEEKDLNKEIAAGIASLRLNQRQDLPAFIKLYHGERGDTES